MLRSDAAPASQQRVVRHPLKQAIAQDFRCMGRWRAVCFEQAMILLPSTRSDQWSRAPMVFAVAGVAGSAASSAPWPALAALVGWFLVWRPARRVAVLGLLLFFVTGARAGSSAREFETRWMQVRQTLQGPRRCAGLVEVIRSPVVRTRWEEAESTDVPSRVLAWTGRASQLDCEGRVLENVVLRLSGGDEGLARGDQVEVVAQLAPVRLFRNAGLPDPMAGAARRGAVLSGGALVAESAEQGAGWQSLIDRARAAVRKRIELTYRPLVVTLGRALVLGENDLTEEDAEAFQRSGLLHLLAVSGTHLVIAVLSIVSALRVLLVRVEVLARRFDVGRIASAVGALASLVYAEFSGGSGSAWRAAFMLCLVCGGRALGFRVAGVSALGGSLIVGVLLDPLAGSDLSFLLSALATVGLIGLGQPVTRWLSRGVFARAPLRQLVESFVATVTSTLPCAPLLAMMDGEMTWAALFANVVAAPLGELLALPACLLHGVAAPFPALERGLAAVGSGALVGVREVALWSASVESARFTVGLPNAWDVCLLFLGGAALAWLTPRQKGLAILAALTLALSLVGFRSAKPTPEQGRLSVTALDVGQGDALIVDFPDGRLGLVDGGGFPMGVPDTGSRVILPYLRSRGRSVLDLMVLTHPHPDHVLGLVTVAEARHVRELWQAVTPKRGSAHERLVRAVIAGGGRVLGPRELCGSRRFGGVQVDVLWPCPASVISEADQPHLDQSNANQVDEPLSPNDTSLVLRLDYGRRSVLLTGDIERGVEQRLVERQASRLDVDLLKVAHHGSDTSSTLPFLDAVMPAQAMISSGVRNRFRHPRPTTLQHLAERGSEVLRTDLLGSVTWATDGQSAEIRSFSSGGP